MSHDRTWKVVVRIVREATVEVVTHSRESARNLAAAGRWEDLVWHECEKDGEVTVDGDPVCVEDERELERERS